MFARLFIASVWILAALSSADAEGVGETRTFGDWFVGCDNRKACTAIGMVEAMDFAFAYVRIVRSGEPDAPLGVRIVAVTEDIVDGTGTLALSLDGGTLPASTRQVSADLGGSYATADLGAADSAALITALLPAQSLAVTIDNTTASVSLSGMSAALRWMDESQGRVGARDALVATGERTPASSATVPAPAIEPVALVALDPLPTLPAEITAPNEDCNDFATPVAFARADDPERRAVIAGRCVWMGAYNAGYSYVRIDGEATSPLPFVVPGRTAAEGDDQTVLVNADLDPDGRRIVSFDKGRGLGDCGAYSEWVFDGTAAHLVTLAEMGECRGVAPDDWPVVYRAEAD